jgi:hypothetical protein
LPDTLADRCIMVRMQRKTLWEECERLRTLDVRTLRERCEGFVEEHSQEIAEARPAIPDSLNDRAADIWEPLLVLADIAGGHWPETARKAATGLSASAQEHNPIGSLLFDLFVIFTIHKAERLFTRTILEELNWRTDRPWAEMRKGKKVSDMWLARQLRPYGIRPKGIWVGEEHAKGYLWSDFEEVFRRYIPMSEVEAFRAEGKQASAPKKGAQVGGSLMARQENGNTVVTEDEDEEQGEE